MENERATLPCEVRLMVRCTWVGNFSEETGKSGQTATMRQYDNDGNPVNNFLVIVEGAQPFLPGHEYDVRFIDGGDARQPGGNQNDQ